MVDQLDGVEFAAAQGGVQRVDAQQRQFVQRVGEGQAVFEYRRVPFDLLFVQWHQTFEAPLGAGGVGAAELL